MILLDVPKSVDRDLTVNAVRSAALSPQERFAKDREGFKRDYQHALLADANDKAAHSVAPDNGRPRTILEAQRGLVLDSSVITARLKSLNGEFVFQRAIADPALIGVYIKSQKPEHQPEGLAFTGVSFNHGPNPEFCVLRKKEDRVDHDGTVHPGECCGIAFIGWRTALARLIRQRLISEVQAEFIFGLPTNQSQFWATATGKRTA